MMKRLSTVMAVAIVAAIGQTSSAATIDTFLENLTVNNVTPGTTATNTQPGLPTSAVIGGERHTVLSLSDNNFASMVLVIPANGGATFTHNNANEAAFAVVYGNTTPLNADLTDGGASNAFTVDVLQALPSGQVDQLEISVTADGETASRTQNLSGSTGEITVPFSLFTGSGGQLDFTKVSRIDFIVKIGGPVNVASYTFGSFETGVDLSQVIPSPSAALGGFALLLGLAMRRRRPVRR